MENATTDFAAAIQEIQNKAIAAGSNKILTIEADDGRGGNTSVPVVILQGTGCQEAKLLLGELQRATEFAREQRLLKADGPDRREGTAAHQSIDSFIAHANRFKAENSAVWAHATDRKLVSILDYHPAGAASPAKWGRHRGVYPCPLSEAWLAWGGSKGLELSQDGFAELLDRRDRELVAGKFVSGASAPTPASLITLANNLEVYSSATAKRERDPNTGRLKISYTEDKGVSGDIMPPPAFLVGIPVFQDALPQVLEVRLRVSVENGHAKFSVHIHAPNDILRASFSELCDRVRAETSLPVFVGTPEQP